MEKARYHDNQNCVYIELKLFQTTKNAFYVKYNNDAFSYLYEEIFTAKRQ